MKASNHRAAGHAALPSASYDDRGVRADSVTNQLRVLAKPKPRKRQHPVLEPIEQVPLPPTNIGVVALERASVQKQIQGPVSLQWVVDDFVQAAGTGDLEKVDHYIRGGVPIDMQHSVLHQTALHASMALKNDTVTRHLVQAGANINSVTKERESALHLAARYHSIAVAELVLRNQAVLNVRNTRFMLAMDVAAEVDDKQMEQLLEPPPSAPSNAMATSVSSTSVTIAWQSHARGASAYLFRVSWVLSRSLGESSETCSSSSFRIANLMPASQYEIRVQTGNHTVGWSASSEPLVVETEGDVPNAMAAPFVIRVSNQSLSMRFRLPPSNGAPILRISIQLQCTGSLAAVSTSSIRRLLRPSDQDTRWESVVCDAELMRTSESNPHEKEHTVDGLLPGHVYYIRVKVCNRFGWSPDGEVSDGICTNAAPSAVASTARTVTLVWTKPYSTELIDAYEVHARASYSTKWEVVARDLVDQRAIVEDLIPATAYNFRVVPHFIDTGWEDAESCARMDLHSTLTTVPEPPLNARVVDRTAQTIVLSWEMPRCNGHAIDAYRVEQRAVHGPQESEWTLVNEEVSVDCVKFTVVNLSRGTPYEFRVSAHNAMGHGPFSIWSQPPAWTYGTFNSPGACSLLISFPDPTSMPKLAFLPPTPPVCVDRTSFSLSIAWHSGEIEAVDSFAPSALYEVQMCHVDSSLRNLTDLVDVISSSGEWHTVGSLQHESHALVGNLHPLSCYCFRVRACLATCAEGDESSSVLSPISAVLQTLRRM